VFVVVAIALSSILAGWEAIRRLLDPQPVRNLPLVALAAIIGFIGNELVASYRIRVGREIGSAALVADGLHARTDGLTSLAVLAGAVSVAFGYPRADPIVGLVIAVAILFVLKDAARAIYFRLMDVVAPELVGDIESVLRTVNGVEAVDTVRVRWIGHRLRAEAEIQADCRLTLEDAHAIAEEAHHQLLHDIPRLSAAAIHVDPCPHEDREYHERVAHHFAERRHEIGPAKGRR
jgi:cation diffusion facilitator family transporter